jgi:hypothetical protein
MLFVLTLVHRVVYLGKLSSIHTPSALVRTLSLPGPVAIRVAAFTDLVGAAKEYPMRYGAIAEYSRVRLSIQGCDSLAVFAHVEGLAISIGPMRC